MTVPPQSVPKRFRSLPVGQAMRGPPVALRPECSVKQACRILRDAGAAEALVTAGGLSEAPLADVLGILTHGDLARSYADGDSISEAPVTAIMHSRVVTIDIHETVDHALFELQRLRVHRLPVTSGSRIFGLLTTESLLEAKAHELERLRETNEHLTSAATHDSLTHLANRRLFDEALLREVARSHRTGQALGLLMIDIDHFKRINDEYGHQRGDLVLQELSSRLLATVRRADLVARFGGEEFVVVASVPNERALLVLAEKLRLRVAETPFMEEPDQVHQPRSSRRPSQQQPHGLRVTVSVGAALLTPETSGKELIAAADAALYQAKEAGRNCIRPTQAHATLAHA